MLVATNLVKRFGAVTAVDGVTLSVPRGTVFGLLGPNGAGKTTTIRMLLGILTPDEGTIAFEGDAQGVPFKHRVGYLPEERGLYRKRAVLETILYFAALKGIDPVVAKQRALVWMERFGLVNTGKRRIEELSKGNQQKVQFIISVLHAPDLLVLDEPFSGLDPVNQEILLEIIVELKRTGTAIVFSTHQMEQAEKLCEHICLIDRGKIVLDGTVGDVRRKFGRHAIRAEYTGSGSLASLPGVTHVDEYGTYAELQLSEDADVNTIVRSLTERVSLRGVQLLEPSLHAIFLDVIGGAAVSEVAR
jgi:ABC-2 type transport system ATP-binding protein